MTHYVFRHFTDGGCKFCDDFETEEQAIAYIKRRKEKNPLAQYQVFSY